MLWLNMEFLTGGAPVQRKTPSCRVFVIRFYVHQEDQRAVWINCLDQPPICRCKI